MRSIACCWTFFPDNPPGRQRRSVGLDTACGDFEVRTRTPGDSCLEAPRADRCDLMAGSGQLVAGPGSARGTIIRPRQPEEFLKNPKEPSSRTPHAVPPPQVAPAEPPGHVVGARGSSSHSRRTPHREGDRQSAMSQPEAHGSKVPSRDGQRTTDRSIACEVVPHGGATFGMELL